MDNSQKPLSKAERPRIELETGGIDRTLLFLSLTAAAAITIRVALSWSSLPDTIAVHFNAMGRADGFGSRYLLLVMPGLAWLMHIGMSVVRRFPHSFNYAWPITAANAGAQYGLALGMISWMRFEVTLLMAYIGWVMTEAADGSVGHLGIWFLPVSIAAILATLAVYLVLAFRNRSPSGARPVDVRSG